MGSLKRRRIYQKFLEQIEGNEKSTCMDQLGCLRAEEIWTDLDNKNVQIQKGLSIWRLLSLKQPNCF